MNTAQNLSPQGGKNTGSRASFNKNTFIALNLHFFKVLLQCITIPL